ncbi:MAG: hypothetical protein ACYSX0_10250 [Planctomycetota bacterium]|jgi:hypothetical protein
MIARTLVGLVAILVLVAPGSAGDRENALEIERAQELVHEWLREAEELEELGKHDRADVMRRKARDLQARIDGARKKHLDKGDLHEILKGLEHGIVALKRLNRREEVKHLEGIADRVRRELRDERKERGHGERKGRERSEREVGMHQLEVMQMALHAFREAEKRDLIEAMERVVHARKLGLEGRRDEEARRIYERSPGVEDQIELLMVAAELWADFGHEKKAKTIYALAKEMKGHVKRRKGKKEEGRAEHFEHAMHRVEQLEQRVKRLTNMVEELHHMVRELHKER